MTSSIIDQESFSYVVNRSHDRRYILLQGLAPAERQAEHNTLTPTDLECIAFQAVKLHVILKLTDTGVAIDTRSAELALQYVRARTLLNSVEAGKLLRRMVHAVLQVEVDKPKYWEQ